MASLNKAFGMKCGKKKQRKGLQVLRSNVCIRFYGTVLQLSSQYMAGGGEVEDIILTVGGGGG